MKKHFVLALSFILLFLFLPQLTQAQIPDQMVAPAIPEEAVEILQNMGTITPSFFGHEHAYTVTLRGNGDAHVVLKAAFTNSAEATSSAVIFKIPNTAPKDLVAYQVIREGQCMSYTPYTPTSRAISIPDCEEYDEPNYFEPYYYGNIKYKKATVSLESDGIKVQLPESISPEKSGSILLFYTSPFYTSKTVFGAYTFTFETLTVAEPIRSLQVGINTDTNLNIKGVASEVQYGDVFTPSVAVQEFSKGYSTDSTSQYFGQIGNGRMVKTAYELQPNESYTVTGTYGSTWWSLYAMEVIIAVVLIIVAGIIIIVLLRKLYRKIVSSVKNESNEDTLPKNKQNTLLVLGLSFISSFLIGGYSVFQFFIIMLIQRQYYDSAITLFIGLVLFLISILIYGLLFVGPALFVGIKKGTMWGIGTFVAILSWLFLYVLIVLLLTVYLRTMFSNRNIPLPVSEPYIEGIRQIMPSVAEDTIVK